LCDAEGTVLVQRADDTEKVFEERMRAYAALTAPVVEHYRALGRFAEVDGDRPIESIAAGIVATVERLRG
jgi:adenylate kinase